MIVLNYQQEGVLMELDKNQLSQELSAMFTTIPKNSTLDQISVRLEEILSNYLIERKSMIDIENDISDKIEMFLAAKDLEGLSKETLKGYRIELNIFERHTNKAIEQITTFDLRRFLANFKELKPSSLEKKISVLKSFFGWLVDEEIIIRNPASKIKSPKQEKRLPKGLSIEELEKVRESCKTLRERALIEVFYSTGCRLSELANMKKSDINMQAMNLKVVGKGNKERVVYLSFKAIYHLEKYLKERKDDCDALFTTLRKPYRAVKNRAIQREIDKIEQRADITKKLTPHVMRHTYAMLSMEAGIELTDLQHLLGHSNPSTTLIYGQVSEERKQQAYKKYHVQ